MNDKDWKYQYSNSDGKGGILVARTDELEDVEEMKGFVDGVMGKTVSTSTPQATTQTIAPIAEHTCLKHNVVMKEREGYQGKPNYWDHRRKNGEEWEKCKGFGFPSELRTSIDDSFKEDF